MTVAEDEARLIDTSAPPYEPLCPMSAAQQAAEVERIFLDLYGPNPRPFFRPALNTAAPRLQAEFRERWDEAMQDSARQLPRILGVSDEDHERAAWALGVKIKLDSALFALANGWRYAWDHPYEYATTWCPICGGEMLCAAPEEHERACDAKLAGHQFTGLLSVMQDGATYGGSDDRRVGPDGYRADDHWHIGWDTTAAYARQALDAAGIAPDKARTMTRAKLSKVPGIGPAELDRLWAHRLYADWESR